jgi:hypothetical protein
MYTTTMFIHGILSTITITTVVKPLPLALLAELKTIVIKR